MANGLAVSASEPHYLPDLDSVVVVRYVRGRWLPVMQVRGCDDGLHFQSLPGNRILAVRSQSRRRPDALVEANAIVYSDAGAITARLALGDGIADVQATTAGDIWVAYSLQGTMGDYGVNGWGRISPELWVAPSGESGLVRFGAEGMTKAAFRPPHGFLPIVDCSALNVGRHGAWVSYHPRFPIVHVGVGDRSTGWDNEGIWGVDAFAVSGTSIFLHALTGVDHEWIQGRLVDGKLSYIHSLVALSNSGVQLSKLLRVVGRGSYLHAFTEIGWLRVIG